jgi:chromosome partitioning protein
MASLPVHISSQPNSGIFILKDVLARTTQPTPLYDVVILDLAPARGPVQATALAAATRCIAPVQPEDLVVKALTDLVETVAQAQRLNPQLRGISIVRNKYTVRSAGDQVYDQLLRDSYGDRLLNTVIPVRAALRDSPGLGQSIFRYSGSDAADVRGLFLDLLDELMALDGGA